MRSRVTSVAGLRVQWREAGRGDPLVLVHGIGVSGRYLVPTARVLAPRFHVLVPDLPGFGQSEKPRRPLGVRGCARALAAWLDAVGVERASFLANSMGCQVLIELAVAQPDRVDSLVLVGPTVDAGARSFVRQTWRLGVDMLREPPSLVALAAFEYALYGPIRFVHTARSALAHRPEERARHVAAPTLVVRGERDALVSDAFAAFLAERLAARVAVVPGSPHAVNYAAPEALATLANDFLTARSAGVSG